jgi:demethylmenaquinone methyltransferase/2-methoxy-6-polyprenyl-1,4-benzoquinol methylase
MRLDAHLKDPAKKQSFVTPMFEMIAPRYDRFTQLFSYGLDRRWKDEMMALLAARAHPSMTVVDVACGTGDLAFDAAALVPNGRVIGIDAAPSMIDLASERARRAPTSNLSFEVGDMTDLDFDDQSVDVVTGGYALRNAPSHLAALDEIHRVLRPGGFLLTLDFYRPRSTLWRTLFLSYLSAAGNTFGWVWHREGMVYGYIAHSIEYFVSAEAFSAALELRGFNVEHARRKLLGGVAIHCARKL